MAVMVYEELLLHNGQLSCIILSERCLETVDRRDIREGGNDGMKRNVSLADISDGRLYGENDMVKADCHGCVGCSDCCRGMGDTIVLNPYDVYRLTTGLKRSLGELLQKEIELGVVDGCVLPHLRMTEADESCAFLDESGRCSIHPWRPGVCRLFPLGRYYENGEYKYFLQTGECKAVHTKVKVSKWIDTPDRARYKEFVTCWHYLLNDVEKKVAESDDSFARELNMFLLKTFYLTPYEEQDFYQQFEQRKEKFDAFTS